MAAYTVFFLGRRCQPGSLVTAIALVGFEERSTLAYKLTVGRVCCR